MEQLEKVFESNGSNIRVVEKENQPWFVLEDVCSVLGLRSPDVRQRLSDDVVSTSIVTDSLGKRNKATIIKNI